MRLKLFTLALAVTLVGCSARRENPQWLTELNSIECNGVVSSACLSKVVSDHLSKSASTPFLMSGALHYIAAAEAKGASWTMPSSLNAENAVTANAFAEAIRLARTDTAAKALEASKKITDIEARNLALYFVVEMNSHQSSIEGGNAALEMLFKDDPDLYRRAMHKRLETLLAAGDLERAHALRKHLVQSSSVSDPNLGPDLNDVALVYARTGMTGDLSDWIDRIPDHIPDIKSGDEADLRRIMVNAALGHPPGVDVLGNLRRQEVRFAAYLELARLYRLLGNIEYEKRAIQDAVLFSQVSSMTLSRPIAVEYLSLMWFESKSI